MNNTKNKRLKNESCGGYMSLHPVAALSDELIGVRGYFFSAMANQASVHLA